MKTPFHRLLGSAMQLVRRTRERIHEQRLKRKAAMIDRELDRLAQCLPAAC